MKLEKINKENPCIHIKLNIKRKSGRSWIITPDGSDPVFEEVKIDNTLLKALAKAHLWKRELKRGKYSSIQELAEQKQLTQAYVRRILNLCYLSPRIKEMILDGKLTKCAKLQDIIYDVLVLWKEQEERWLG